MGRFHKHDIARAQLETAIEIFLRGLDYSSVITLAGAASGILDALVRKAGKEAFVDYARRVHHHRVGHTPKRESYAHHIEKRLGITAHKHLSKAEPEVIELDLERLAVDALNRAVADYVTLNGQDEPFIREFLGWCWKNMDGAEMMERYKKVPPRLMPKK